MIQIFYGDDRTKAERAIRQFLGSDYEVFDGPTLEPSDLPSLFLGTSLFGDTRRILIKDLSESKSAWAKLPDYLETSHQVALWEQKFDKRSATNKTLAAHQHIKLQEFKLPVKIDRNFAFNLYDTALRDGPHAVQLYRDHQDDQDPYMLLGAWTWKAIDNLKKRPTGAKEKRVLRELSQLDMQMKSTTLSSRPELLLQSFLLRASSL